MLRQFCARTVRVWLGALLLVGLSACSNPTLEELRHAAPKGTPFQNELAKLYLTYADVAQRYGDYDTASLFAEKGLKAAYGNDVAPENPADWPLGKHMEDYTTMHAETTALLTSEAIELAPQAAAGSIFFYDCMLDQQVHHPEDQELNYCSEQWQAMLGDVREALSGHIADQSLLEEPVGSEPAPERFLVYFALDQYHLSDAAKRTVELLYAELMKQGASVSVVVNGHTDTSGSDRHNMMLSNRRADTIKQMLVAMGMSTEAIATYGFGETDLAVPTTDNVFEPKNRRVEIVVN